MMNALKADRYKLITPRVIRHTHDEIAMGQVIHYVHARVADGISVTANPNGFTTINSVARYFDLDSALISKVCELANGEKDICTIDLDATKIFVVPKTKHSSNMKSLLNRLLEMADLDERMYLNFTHYNFIQGIFPLIEITCALKAFLEHCGKGTLLCVFFDIDSRYAREFFKLYDDIVFSREHLARLDGPQLRLL